MKEKRKKTVVKDFVVRGMVCESCEKIVRKQALGVDGVKDFKIDYGTGKAHVKYDGSKTTLDEIIRGIEEKGYECVQQGETSKGGFLPLLAVVAAFLLIYAYVEPVLEKYIPDLGGDLSLPLIFVVGLLTGFHCVAMCGGFVVGYTTKDASGGRVDYISHLKYGISKTLSYALFGFIFGYVGSLFTFTPQVRALAALLAGMFLILFGLNMLGLLGWYRKITGAVPSVKINGKKGPAVIGFLNGLMLACGPLQAMYVLAAASGSPITGALYLAVFGVGTLPVLLGFGVLTSFMSSKLTHKIVRYSGVIVILLGLIMLNRGLALAGTGYDANSLALQGAEKTGETITLDSDGFQVIRMNVTAAGWSPDTFTLKRGVPVRWVIDGQQITSCNKAIQVPKYGLRFDIKLGLQTIEFTPTESGTIPWSCWMGMITGMFIVTDDISVTGEPQETRTPETTLSTLPESTRAAAEQVGPAVYQTIHMNVTAAGWSPNSFTLKRGVPVRWVIDGQQITGCNKAIKVLKLGLQFNIKLGLQTIEFTPKESGVIPWSCWMGMIRGTFVVKDDVKAANTPDVQAELDSLQAQKGGGGCGCGMMGG